MRALVSPWPEILQKGHRLITTEALDCPLREVQTRFEIVFKNDIGQLQETAPFFKVRKDSAPWFFGGTPRQ